MGTRADRYLVKQLRQADATERRVVHAQLRRVPPTHPTIPSRFRDPIFGTPLTADTLKIHLHDPVSDRPLPARLHTQQPEGRLGGHCYAPAFKRYLHETRPWVQIQDRQNRIYWWKHAWAEREVRAFFTSDQVDAVLAVMRDGANWHVIAQNYGHTISWIERAERGMQHHIARLFDDGLVAI